jgi:hypothetical protein
VSEGEDVFAPDMEHRPGDNPGEEPPTAEEAAPAS